MLSKQLPAGPLTAVDVREAAEAQGFAYVTLRKAFRKLRGIATPVPNENLWQWQLSREEAV